MTSAVVRLAEIECAIACVTFPFEHGSNCAVLVRVLSRTAASKDELSIRQTHHTTILV